MSEESRHPDPASDARSSREDTGDDVKQGDESASEGDASGGYGSGGWRDPSSTRSGSGVPVRSEPAPDSGYPAPDSGYPPPERQGEGAPSPRVPPHGPPPVGHPGSDGGEVGEAGKEQRGREDAETAGWPIRTLERRSPRTWINVVLFVVTTASVLWWAYFQYHFFYLQGGSPPLNPFAAPEALLGGIPYGLAVIVFLLSHEMGHYLACRWYDIDATLPYFIPMPVVIAPLLPGTMGAVIRIVAPIKSRRALFDIAVAGPIAGFVVSLPILALGLSQSRVISAAQLGTGDYLSMGEPLIWEVMAEWFGPATTGGEELLVHPLAYVGWFAMLVTAMNLLPIGQLDGGHLLYALFPRVHRPVSLLALGAMVVAGWFYFPGWIVFALIIFFLLGTRHPRPQRFEASLGGTRLALAVVAGAILVSSFILVPVHLGEFVG